MLYSNNEGKDYFIEILLNIGLFKMPDGRQLYEATENELKRELCSKTNNQFSFCNIFQWNNFLKTSWGKILNYHLQSFYTIAAFIQENSWPEQIALYFTWSIVGTLICLLSLIKNIQAVDIQVSFIFFTGSVNVCCWKSLWCIRSFFKMCYFRNLISGSIQEILLW